MSVNALWYASGSLCALGGVLTRRVAIFALPLGLTLIVFLGLERNWWGGGLGEDWPFVAVVWAATGACATGIGLGLRLLADRVGRGPGGRRWSFKWSAGVLAVWLAGTAVYVFLVTRPANVDAIRDAPGPEVYYLGDSFEGLRLTHASEGRYLTFIYGDCDIPVGQDEGGCSVPLQVQNVSCPGEPTAVVIFAHDRGRGRRAEDALRALRGQARSPRVAFGTNPFGACFPPPEPPGTVRTESS